MAAPRRAGRPPGLVALEAAAVAGLAGAAAGLAARVEAAPPAVWLPALGVAALAGVTLADLASGLVHWFCDTWFGPDTPWIGRWLIAPFREHHDDPGAIARHGALEVSGSNALLAAPLLLAAWPLAPAFGRSFGASLLLVGWGAAVLAGAATNQVHRWAHQARPPRPVARLQRAGLLLAPRHHALHHRGAHRAAYCVTTGWCNAWLDASGLLPWLERRIAATRRALERRIAATRRALERRSVASRRRARGRRLVTTRRRALGRRGRA